MTSIESERHNFLMKGLSHAKIHKNPLELIIELDYSRKEKALHMLSRIGKITAVFSHIPYAAISCEYQDAEHIVSIAKKKIPEKKIERQIELAMQSIKSVYLASTFYVPDSVFSKVYGRNYYFRQDKEFLWNLENIGAYRAHAVTFGKGAKIAIIDSGIDYEHPDLRARFGSVKGINYVNRSARPFDDNGHGTHCAGIAAGIKTGVAPESELYAIKVLNEEGVGSEVAIIAGLEWAVEHSINVASMSLGSHMASAAFEDMVNYASSRNMLMVAASGNDGRVVACYPAAFDNVIAVAAVDNRNEHASFSNIYETNDIAAPGVDIVSTYPGNGYKTFSGTSMATPHAAGAVALAISSGISSEKVMPRMESSAEALQTYLPYDNKWVFGAGLLQADRMLNLKQQKARRWFFR